MDDKLFEKLMESALQADEIVRGDRKPSRTREVTSDIVREIRNSTGLSHERLRACSTYPSEPFAIGNKDDVDLMIRQRPY